MGRNPEPVDTPIVSLFKFMAGHFESLESSLSLIADAVEEDAAHPSQPALEAAVKQLNHTRLHFPHYDALCIMCGCVEQIHYD